MGVEQVRTLPTGATALGKLQIVPAGNGRDIRIVVANLQNNYEYHLVTFEGAALSRASDVFIPQLYEFSGVGDINADGKLEGYGPSTYYDGNPVVFDLDSGALVWDGAGFEGRWITAAQLDDDPALELILSSQDDYNPPSGAVVDGATWLPDWTFLDGFTGQVAVGNFLGTSTGPEFVAFSNYGTSRMFVTQPFYSPISDLDLINVDQALSADVNGDGLDELVTGFSYYGIAAFSPGQNSQIYEYTSPPDFDHYLPGLAVGELDDTDGLDILWSAASNYDGRPSRISFVNYGANESQLVGQFLKGPYSTLALGNFSGDVAEEIAVSRRLLVSEDEFAVPSIAFLNSNSGSQELAITNGIGDPYDDFEPMALVATNLDTDPRPELVSATYLYGNTLQIAAFDNGAAPALWVTELEATPSYYSPNSQLAAIPRNNASSDVAVLSQGRLHVLSGSDGQMAWQSTSYQVDAPESLMIADLDGDTEPEAIMGVGSRVHIIDLQSHLLEQSIQLDFDAIGHAIEFDGGTCVHVIFGESQFMRRACTGAELSRRDYSSDATFVRSLGDSHGPLLLADDQHIWIETPGKENRIIGTDLGVGLGEGNKGALKIVGRRAQLYIGSALGVFKFDFGVDSIFEDGLE